MNTEIVRVPHLHTEWNVHEILNNSSVYCNKKLLKYWILKTALITHSTWLRWTREIVEILHALSGAEPDSTKKLQLLCSGYLKNIHHASLWKWRSAVYMAYVSSALVSNVPTGSLHKQQKWEQSCTASSLTLESKTL